MGFHEGLPAVPSASHIHCNGNHKLYSVSSTSSSISKSSSTTTTPGDNVVFEATVEKPDRKSYLLNNHRSSAAGNSKQNRKDAIKDSLAAILASTKLDDDEDEGSEDFLLAITKGKKNNKTAVRKSHSSELLEMGQKAARIHNKHLIRQRNAEFIFFKSPGRNHSDDTKKNKTTTLRRVKSGGGILAAMQSTLTGGGGGGGGGGGAQKSSSTNQQASSSREEKHILKRSNSDKKSPVRPTRRHSGGVLGSMQNALFHVGEKQQQQRNLDSQTKSNSNKLRASAALDDPFIDYLLNSYQHSPGALKNNGTGGASNKEDRKSSGKFKLTLPNPLAIPGGIGLPTSSNPLNIMRAPLTRSSSDGALKKGRNIQTFSERHDYGGGVTNPKESVRRTNTVTAGNARASFVLSRDAGCPRSAPIDAREYDSDDDVRCDGVTLAGSKNQDVNNAFSSPHQTQRPGLKDFETVTGDSWLGLEAEMPLVDHSVSDSYHHHDTQQGSPKSIRNNSRRSARRSRSPCRSSPRGERSRSSSPTQQDAKLVKRDSWLVLETEIPLIDHSSYDDEVPGDYHQDASSSKSLRATKPRHSHRSHSPKNNSSSSSCDGGVVVLRDDPPCGGGVFSPLDDDDWCGADLEAAIMGASNSSSPRSTTTKSHRRGRSLSDATAADVSSSSTNHRGRRSSRKSRSPGKYEDRTTRCRSSSKHGGTGHHSKSPGKCKERKVITAHGASSSSSSQQQHSGVLYNEFISNADASLKGTPEDLFLSSSSSPSSPPSSSSFLLGTSSYCNMMMMDSSSIRSMTTRNNNNNNP